MQPSTRDRIREAVTALFAERGLDAVSVREIVGTVGMTPSSFLRAPSVVRRFGRKAVRGRLRRVRRVAGENRRRVPPGDPALLTAMVIGIPLKASAFHLYGRLQRSLGELADEIAGACLAVLTPEPAGARHG